MTESVYEGNCLEILDLLPENSVDLVYLDPPFFTQKVHRLKTRDGRSDFGFSDKWDSDVSYADFISGCLTKLHSKLKTTGSVFFHCDKSASHIIRILLDKVFGAENFQSEIIWYFRRWSNSKRGLLNCHQTIFFYSKDATFKFNPKLQEYSPSTNVDQIMQRRSRDERNKSVYARNEKGEVLLNGAKEGVPLSDVWEIPFLNPKAGERVGYPTQKPVVLLKRIIELVTDPGDTVLDPFCGSGTTLVAARILGRDAIGIDESSRAVQLTLRRLEKPTVTESRLLQIGRDAYKTHHADAARHLAGIGYTPVHRNKGIDGILKQEINGLPVFLRVQRKSETQYTAALSLVKATRKMGKPVLVVVTTEDDLIPFAEMENVRFVRSLRYSLHELLSAMCRSISPTSSTYQLPTSRPHSEIRGPG